MRRMANMQVLMFYPDIALPCLFEFLGAVQKSRELEKVWIVLAPLQVDLPWVGAVQIGPAVTCMLSSPEVSKIFLQELCCNGFRTASRSCVEGV